ncbi:MAG: hypothetical protein KDC57_16965 [Saprospiraceae bacterium]|nr:hypothetical protein [Saprospiraceae bacterium]
MNKIIISTLFVLSVMVANSQKPVKPEFKNEPMFFEDGKLIKLETQTAEIKVRAKALGYGGSQMEISVPGGSSPILVSDNPTFYIWVDEGVDPETILILTKTIFSKNKRNVPMMRVSAFAGYGARGKSMAGKYHVPYEIEKMQNGVYKITPSSELEKDMEYAFYNPEKTNSQQIKIFLFGTE